MSLVSAPINMNDREVKDDWESLEVVTRTAAFATEEREGTKHVSSEKLSNWVTTKTRFGGKVGRKSGTYNTATGTTVKWVDRVAAETSIIPRTITMFWESTRMKRKSLWTVTMS